MKEVLVYFTRSCPFCVAARQLLDEKNISYQGIDVGKEPEKRQEMTKKSKGGYTVPQIFIDNTPIGGCTELYELNETGQLDKLIAD